MQFVSKKIANNKQTFGVKKSLNLDYLMLTVERLP